MTHPKVLAMAREIAASVLPAHSKDEVGRAIINGGHDGWYGVQSAIAAIERVTELSAAHLERDAPFEHDGQVVGRCSGDQITASEFRNFDHLPEPEGGSNA